MVVVAALVAFITVFVDAYAEALMLRPLAGLVILEFLPVIILLNYCLGKCVVDLFCMNSKRPYAKAINICCLLVIFISFLAGILESVLSSTDPYFQVGFWGTVAFAFCCSGIFILPISVFGASRHIKRLRSMTNVPEEESTLIPPK